MKWYLLLLLLLIPLVSGSPIVFVQEDTNYSIRFTCELDDAICPSGTLCNVSIQSPNSSVLIPEGETVNVGGARYEYNLTERETEVKGEYFTTVECWTPSTNGTSNFIYEVNSAGIRPTQQRTSAVTRSIYFMFGIGIVLFLVFAFAKLSPPMKWTFFIFSIMFWLIGINILFVGLQDEVVNPKLENLFDSLVGLSFIFLWFCGGLLIIIWGFAFINTWIFKKNLQNAQRYGIA